MKRLLYLDSSQTVKESMLLFIRVIIAFLMLSQHGLFKLQTLLSGEEIRFASVLGISPKGTMSLAMFAEFFCALLIVIGLFTRFAALALIVNMLVIVFHIHGTDPVSAKELPILYLAGFIYIAFNGGGRYSLDRMLFNKSIQKS